MHLTHIQTLANQRSSYTCLERLAKMPCLTLARRQRIPSDFESVLEKLLMVRDKAIQLVISTDFKGAHIMGIIIHNFWAYIIFYCDCICDHLNQMLIPNYDCLKLFAYLNLFLTYSTGGPNPV